MQAADLSVNGVVASAVSLPSARSAVFDFAALPVVQQGPQSVSIAANAIVRAADGVGNAALAASFYFDLLPTAVVAQTPAGGSTLGAPLSQVEFVFNEPILATSVQASDLVLSIGSASAVTQPQPNTLRFAIANQSRDGTLAMSIPAGRLLDAYGNPNPAISSTLLLDYDASMSVLSPHLTGNLLVYSTPTRSGELSFSGDVDTFTLEVPALGRLSAALTTATGLQAAIDLLSDAGDVLATSAASATGRSIGVTIDSVPAGVYRARVRAAGGSAQTGTYTLRLYGNAGLERETFDGPANDSLATAEPLEPASLSLNGSKYAAVIARGGSTDYYSIDMTAGESINARLVGATTSTTLQLVSPTGALVTSSTSTSGFWNISDFMATTAGRYVLAVTNSATDYVLHVSSGIALSTSEAIGRRAQLLAASSTAAPFGVSWSVDLRAGDSIDLQTFTPVGPVSAGAAWIDPRLRILQNGVEVASDNNGAPDGRNAKLYYVAATAGRYSVILETTTAVAGPAGVRVSSSTGYPMPAFAVSASDPVDGASLAQSPATIRLDFTYPVDLRTLNAADLQIDGVPASSVSVVDADTLSFTPASPIGVGDHNLSIAAGAISDGRGTAVAAFALPFGVGVAPRVVSSSVQLNDVRPTGNASFTFRFNYRLQTSVLDATDAILTGQFTGAKSAYAFTYTATTRELRVDYADLPEDRFTLTLKSGANAFSGENGLALDGQTPAWPIPPNITGDGVAGGDFVVTFAVDGPASSIAALDPLGPTSAMAFGGAASRTLAPVGDVDDITIDLVAGQTVSLGVDVASGLAASVALIDANGSVVALTQSAGVGADVVLNCVSIAQSGRYTVRLTSISGIGPVAVSLRLNAFIEPEQFGGTANDTRASADPLDGVAKRTLAPGIYQSTVAGRLSAGSQFDYIDVYRVTLAAGESISAALFGQVNRLSLQDASGATLVTAAVRFGERTIQQFTATSAGTYFVEVRGDPVTPYLLTLQSAALGSRWLQVPQSIDGFPGAIGTAGGAAAHRVFFSDGWQSNRVLEIDPVDGRILRSFSANASSGRIPLTNTPTTFWSIGSNGTLLERAMDTGNAIRTVANPLFADPTAMAFGDDELFLRFNRRVAVLDYRTLAVKRVFDVPLGFGLNGLSYADGRLVAFDGADLKSIDARSGDVRTLRANFVSDARGAFFYRDELFVVRNQIDVYDAATFQFRRTLGAGYPTLSDPAGDRGGADGVESTWELNLNAGDAVVLQTYTPATGIGTWASSLDPAIDVLDANGVVIFSDLNSAPDGRNARLQFAAPGTGRYVVRVRAQSGTQGAFALQVSGATAAQGAFRAVTATPFDGSAFTSSPTGYSLRLNRSIDPSSLASIDLRINGQRVQSPTLSTSEGDLITFAPAGVTLGQNVITLAAGSLRDTAGRLVEAFTSRFTIDAQAPRIIATNVPHGSVRTPGDQTLTFTFDRDIAWWVVTGDDVTLTPSYDGNAKLPDTIGYDVATRTLSLTWRGLTRDAFYSVRFESGADAIVSVAGVLLDGERSSTGLPSGDGVAGGAYAFTFAVDPADSIPLGGFVQQSLGDASHSSVGGTNATFWDAADVDRFVVDLEAGSIVTASALSSVNGWRTRLQVLDPSGIVIRDVVLDPRSGAGGAKQLAPAVRVPVRGAYTFVASPLDPVGVTGNGSWGVYTFLLNFFYTYEVEPNGASTNDSLATAEDLSPHFTPYLASMPGSSRVNLSGTTAGSRGDSVDYFSFDLVAGDTWGFDVDANGSTAYPGFATVLDSSGAMLFSRLPGIGAVAPYTGRYYLKFSQSTGGDLSYTDTLIRNATHQRDRRLPGPDRLVASRYFGYDSTPEIYAYTFDGVAGDDIVIESLTPGDAPGEVTNTLDLWFQLYAPDGTMTVVDGNTAGDGRNERLVKTLDQTGQWKLQLRKSTDTSGAFVLRTQGVRAPATPAFTASLTSTYEGQNQRNGRFTFEFSDPILATSLSASDFTFNGIPAKAIALQPNGTQVLVTLPDLPDGACVVQVAAGAITGMRLNGVAAFTSTVGITIGGPRVVYSSVQRSDVLAAGPQTFVFRFSGKLSASSISPTSVLLTGLTTGSFTPTLTYNASADVLIASFANLPVDTFVLTMRGDTVGGIFSLNSNQLDGETPRWPISVESSGDGEKGGDFVVRFSTQAGPQPIRLTPVAPAGAMVVGGSASAVLTPTAPVSQSFVDIAEGQLLSLAVEPTSSTLQPTLTLRGPSGVFVAMSAAGAAGLGAMLEVSNLAAGRYTIEMGSVTPSPSGVASLRVLVNAAHRAGAFGGAGNQSQATAQSLTASAIDIGTATAGARYAVTGNAAPLREDWYSIDLASPRSLRLALRGAGVSQIAIVDAAGNVIVSTVSAGSYAPMYAATPGYELATTAAIASAGRYFLRVTGRDASPYTLVALTDARAVAGAGEPFSIPLGEPVLASPSGPSVAILQDAPAGADYNLIFSQAMGFRTTVVSSDELATVDLGRFDMVVLAGQQSTEFYQRVQASMTRVESFVSAGGVWLANYYSYLYRADAYQYDVLPGAAGAQFVQAYQNTVSPLEAGNDLVAGPFGRVPGITGIMGSVLPSGTVLGFGYQLNIAGARKILGTSAAQPDIVSALEYPFGAGSVIVSTINLELFNGTGTIGQAYHRNLLAFAASKVRDADDYAVQVQAGVPLYLGTRTPDVGSAAGSASGLVDPYIEVRDGAGNLVASNDNAAPDGRNARLTFTPGTTGTYSVRVGTRAGRGAYVLDTTPSAFPVAAEFTTAGGYGFRVRFSEPVDAASVIATDLDVVHVRTGASLIASRVELSGDRRTATWYLPTNAPDGEYTGTLPPSRVSVAGQPLARSISVSGQQAYVLAGDFNRDRRVDFDDLLILASHYNQPSAATLADGDADLDGDVDFDDLLLLASRYNTTIPA